MRLVACGVCVCVFGYCGSRKVMREPSECRSVLSFTKFHTFAVTTPANGAHRVTYIHNRIRIYSFSYLSLTSVAVVACEVEY